MQAPAERLHCVGVGEVVGNPSRDLERATSCRATKCGNPLPVRWPQSAGASVSAKAAQDFGDRPGVGHGLIILAAKHI